jgi:tetratricopeptide (TPR) repeat protein
MGRYQLTYERFQKFLKQSRTAVTMDAEFKAGDCLLHVERFDAAIDAFRTIIDKYPGSLFSARSSLKLAEAYRRKGDVDHTIETYRVVIGAFPDRIETGQAAYALGRLYLAQEDFDNAIKYFELTSEAFPNNPQREELLFYIARAYQRKGDFRKALRSFEHLQREYPNSWWLSRSFTEIGQMYVYTGEPKRAIAHFEGMYDSLTTSEERRRTNFLLAESYAAVEGYESAYLSYKKYLKNYPKDKLQREAQFGMGWSSYRMKKYERAAAELAQCTTTLDELGTRAYFYSGVCYQFSGKTSEALQQYQVLMAPHVESDLVDNTYWNSAAILYDRGNYTDAAEFCRVVMERFPSSDIFPSAVALAAESNYMIKEFDKAEVYFEQALQFPGLGVEERANLLHKLGMCRMFSGRAKAAIGVFREFLMNYTNHPAADEVRRYLAEALYASGDYQAALEILFSIADTPSKEVRAATQRRTILCLFALGRYDSAIVMGERLLSAMPDWSAASEIRLKICDSYLDMRDNKLATGSYRIFLRLFPNDSLVDYASFRLAVSELSMGDKQRAMIDFAKIALHSSQPSYVALSQFAVGWIWFQTKEYSQALREFNKCILQYGTNPIVPRCYIFMKEAYARLGQYDVSEAITREHGSMLSSLDPAEILSDSSWLQIPKFIEKQIRSTPQLKPVTIKMVLPKDQNIKPTIFSPLDVQLLEIDSHHPFDGRLNLSAGNYYTASGEFGVEGIAPKSLYALSGNMFSTQGFLPNTDQMSADIHGGLVFSPVLFSSSLEDNIITADVEYLTKRYRLYGSLSPSNLRTVNYLDGSLHLEHLRGSSITSDVTFSTFSVQDSSGKKNENIISFNISSEIPISDLFIKTRLGGDIFFSGGTSGYDIELNLSSQVFRKNAFTITTGLGCKGVKDYSGSSKVFLTPSAIVDYAVSERHSIFIRGASGATSATFMSEFKNNSYLQLDAIPETSPLPLALEVGSIFQWNDNIGLMFTADYQIIEKSPIFIDSLRFGMWELDYGHTLKIFTISLETFAKLSTNDYFLVSLNYRWELPAFAENTIPYFRNFACGLNYIHRFSNSITTSGACEVLGSEHISFGNEKVLPWRFFLTADIQYRFNRSWTASMKANNILNEKIGIWDRYERIPFVVSGNLKFNF